MATNNDLSLQVLVSTMHQTDHSLLEKMNIQTDAIVVNQCDRNEIEEFEYKNHKIKWLSLNERGVGLSRNTALMRADADILLFADDDIVYEDGFAQKVIDFFKNHPRVSFAVFNIQSLNPDRPEFLDTKDKKLNFTNSLKYGACRVAVRREKALKANISYSLLFGGGAPHKAGEDNLFITNCLQKGLKGMASKIMLGTVKQEESSWFDGYNEKYYTDRGALFCAMYGKMAKPMILLFELKSILRKSNVKLFERIRYEFKGVKEFKK